MAERSDCWEYREIHCEGKPMPGPPTRFLSTIRHILATDAAAFACEELDAREFREQRAPLEKWTVQELDGELRTIEVRTNGGSWQRFAVLRKCQVTYEAEPLK